MTPPTVTVDSLPKDAIQIAIMLAPGFRAKLWAGMQLLRWGAKLLGQREPEIRSSPPAPSQQVVTEITAERMRQVEKEGWTPDHDDKHTDSSMANAAACYATAYPTLRKVTRTELVDMASRGDTPMFERKRITYRVPVGWPRSWHPNWYKPKDRRRDLVRAAALIVAEIERLDRLSDRLKKPVPPAGRMKREDAL